MDGGYRQDQYRKIEASSSSDTQNIYDDTISNQSQSQQQQLTMRLCHMRKRAGENGYGFNLMSKRDKLCQYVGKVDVATPAYNSGLRTGDKIIEIDNINVARLTYREIMDLIRKGLRIGELKTKLP